MTVTCDNCGKVIQIEHANTCDDCAGCYCDDCLDGHLCYTPG